MKERSSSKLKIIELIDDNAKFDEIARLLKDLHKRRIIN